MFYLIAVVVLHIQQGENKIRSLENNYLRLYFRENLPAQNNPGCSHEQSLLQSTAGHQGHQLGTASLSSTYL